MPDSRPVSQSRTSPDDLWAALGEPRARGLCTRCRKAEATMHVRLFAQARNKGGKAGKTTAGRSVRCCESCAVEVYRWTAERLEIVAASTAPPDDRLRDALKYVLTYLEADEAGAELNAGLDLNLVRRALADGNS